MIPGAPGPGPGRLDPVRPVPAAPCPVCGNLTPAGHYCGVCGAHLSHAGDRLAQRRAHSYLAFPDEPVLCLSVITSLFPHLSHRSTLPFRVGAGLLVALLALFAATGVEATVIALAALGLPLLFQLYVYEVDVYEDHRVALTAVTLLVGAGLGIGWGLVGGPVVASALAPSLGSSLTGTAVAKAAVAVPVVGQALMCVPLLLVLALLPRLRSGRESLDGFVLGAAGALGFTCAAIVTDLAANVSAGVIQAQPFADVLTEALVRGIAQPVVAAAGTGLIGAAVWVRRSPGLPALQRLLTSPLSALLAVLAVQVGLGYADQGRLSDIPLLAVHLGAAALLLLGLRVGLHHIMLHEQHEVGIGLPRVCPLCHHLVPAMAFCPACGVAQVATSKRRRHEPVPVIPPGEPAEPAEPEESGEGPIRGGWPIAVAGDVGTWSGYPLAGPSLAPLAYRARHLRVLGLFLAGLAVFAGALLITAVVSAPGTTPYTRCRFLCVGTGQRFVPDTLPEGAPARTWASAAGGFSVALLLSDDAANPGYYPDWQTSESSQLLSIDLDASSGTIGKKRVTLDKGEIQFYGFRSGSEPAETVVDDLISQNAPGAVMAYPLPDALVGYEPGYGAVYDLRTASSNGEDEDYRLIVAAAVRDGVAVVVWADGPKDATFPQSPLVLHPSFADLDAALVLDPMVNSVQWTGGSLHQ